MIVFAQLSDTHLDGSQHRADRVRAVMASLAGGRAPLDAVLVTGDVADHGLPSEYEQARSLLAGPWPVLICPGNHDERAAFRRVLLGGEGDLPINQVHRMPGAVFALCDSTIPGHDDGYLADDTLAWLDSELRADPATPAFVVLHHQPVLLHTETSDVIRLSGEDRLAAVIGRHPQVIAVLCGHAHSAAATTFAGRRCWWHRAWCPPARCPGRSATAPTWRHPRPSPTTPSAATAVSSPTTGRSRSGNPAARRGQ